MKKIELHESKNDLIYEELGLKKSQHEAIRNFVDEFINREELNVAEALVAIAEQFVSNQEVIYAIHIFSSLLAHQRRLKYIYF